MNKKNAHMPPDYVASMKHAHMSRRMYSTDAALHTHSLQLKYGPCKDNLLAAWTVLEKKWKNMPLPGSKVLTEAEFPEEKRSQTQDNFLAFRVARFKAITATMIQKQFRKPVHWSWPKNANRFRFREMGAVKHLMVLGFLKKAVRGKVKNGGQLVQKCPDVFWTKRDKNKEGDVAKQEAVYFELLPGDDEKIKQFVLASDCMVQAVGNESTTTVSSWSAKQTAARRSITALVPKAPRLNTSYLRSWTMRGLLHDQMEQNGVKRICVDAKATWNDLRSMNPDQKSQLQSLCTALGLTTPRPNLFLKKLGAQHVCPSMISMHACFSLDPGLTEHALSNLSVEAWNKSAKSLEDEWQHSAHCSLIAQCACAAQQEIVN